MSTKCHATSAFQAQDLVPPDVSFDVTRRFLADNSENKINLGQGTYRDENGQPWVLPSVKMAKASLDEFNHEYLPILGFQPFRDEASRLLYKGTRALNENTVSVQKKKKKKRPKPSLAQFEIELCHFSATISVIRR
jgi:aspartate aminotransferase